MLLLVIASVLLSFVCSLSPEDVAKLRLSEDEVTVTAFVDFVSTYNKNYATSEEMDYRFQVFKQGLALAQVLNENSQKLGGATYGVTKFSDLTPKEFKEMYLMTQFEIPQELLNDKKYHNVSVSKPVQAGVTAFDWVGRGVLTGVYDQGACGSCWAFSATENLESVFARKHGVLRNLSPQQIVSCDGKYGCNGGSPTQAWTYIYEQKGLDTLQCYPYVAVAQACEFKPTCVGATLTEWSWIYPNNENDMAAWLSEGAPISVCLRADNWQFYKGGVVLEAQCPATTLSDHCVLITGYNLDTNPRYWHIRNSWGTAWGEAGYIRLQWGANTCGVACYPASVTVA